MSDNPSLTIKRATAGGGVGQIIVIGKKYNLITDVTTIENENDFLYLSFSKLIFNNGVNKTNTMLSLSKQYHAYPNTDWTGHIAFEIGTVQESGLVQNYNTTYSILVSLT